MVMKTLARKTAAAALVLGSFGFGAGLLAAPAGAATRTTVVAAMKAKSWTGKVDSVVSKKHEFTMSADGKMYSVKWDSMTKWSKKLSAKTIKKGDKVTVTGTKMGSHIKASKIS